MSSPNLSWKTHTHTERQTVSAASVRREVVYQEDGGVSLSLSLPWLTDCFPLFSLELAERGGGGGGTVLHDRLVPRVTGTGAEREVQLTVPLQGRDNTHYTAQLSSTSSERTLAAQERLNYSELVPSSSTASEMVMVLDGGQNFC